MNVDEDMKYFLQVVEYFLPPEVLTESHMITEQEVIVETVVQLDEKLIKKLEDLIFTFESYQSTEDGDIGLGMEMGMNKAAELLGTVLNRIRESE